jgi:acyl-CoA thioesterase
LSKNSSVPFVSEDPFLSQFEIQVKDSETTHPVFEVEICEKHLRSAESVHGNSVTILIDAVMEFTAIQIAPENMRTLSLQLNINRNQPEFKAKKLIARSRVRHAGQMTCVVQGKVRDENGVVVATASGTYMYVPNDE